MSNLTVSIVLYKNERKVLLEAISSVLKSKLNLLLYLVDNSPTDDLRNICLDSRCIYVHNPSNPGFGAAHNLAIKRAIAEQSQFHLVLNPDVYFDENVLEKLKAYMNYHSTVGNIMPLVKYPNGNIQYLCKLLPTPYDWIGRRFNPFKAIVLKRNNIFELRFTQYNKTMSVPYLSGCFMFLRVSSLLKVGLFDENIFMYGEETDLCRRLNAAEYETIFYPEVSIIHHFEKGSHKSLKLTWIGIRSAIYYFNKWGWFFDKERRLINQKALRQFNIKGDG